MKAVALISNNDLTKCQWQFDRIMAAIAYDFDLSVVFICEGIQQIISNKAWKCLSRYGVDKVYYHGKNRLQNNEALFNAELLSQYQLQKLIKTADVLL